MNSITLATVASVAIALYAVFLYGNGSKGLTEAERRAEDAICQEIAADTLNGVETLATYMQTRCPARYLTEGRDTQPDAATGTAGQTGGQAAGGSDDGETTGDGAPANGALTGDEAGEGPGDTEGTTP